MNHTWKICTSRFCLGIAAVAAATLIVSEPVLARGAAASIMNSPGYQRRLQESRQQLVQPVVPLSPTHRHKSRHRHHH